jgi:tetratricopeptide (TPR) repeat protein
LTSVVGQSQSVARTLPVVVALMLLLRAAPAVAAEPPNDATTALQAAYATFYRGDRAGADAQFRDIEAHHPGELGGLFGQLVVAHARLAPESGPSPAFERAIDAFIATATDRYDRNHSDDDALFHLAFAYTLRSGYKLEHQKGFVGAGRDGGRARGYVDTFLKAHPDNGDAHLVRGLYNYFVDLAPSFVHVFRFLLLLPGGSRVGGLQDIEFAAAHGEFFGRMAQLQLVPIYGALEGRPADATALGERLEHDFPASDDVGFALADVYISPAVEELDRAGRIYEAILERHRADTSEDGSATVARAQYGLAGARFEAWRCDEALAILSKTLDTPGPTIDWVVPRFLLRRAGYRMLTNDSRAADDAKRVLNDPAMGRWRDDAHDTLKAIEEYKSSGDPTLYAALIPANRLVVEGEFDQARAAYSRIAQGRMTDPQVRYRLAWLDFKRGQDVQARPAFEGLTTDHASPDWVRAAAWLYLGRIDDLAGQRPAAVKAYHKVTDDYSSESAAPAAQVGLITPYRRPPR